VCSFTLAVDDRVKDAQGNKTTTFIGVTVFNNQADNCAKFLRKGSLAGVDGRIRQRTFERRDGSKASVIEIVADYVTFLDPASKNREIPNEEVVYDEIRDETPVDESKNLDSIEVTDDDLPF
jgi:single-strand DNA-binding protein